MNAVITLRTLSDTIIGNVLKKKIILPQSHNEKKYALCWISCFLSFVIRMIACG